jgi:regulator of protease activity HflC (stomatin/prohibitin superfamily)
VPTSILTLNWSKETSASHNLDSQLAPIDAKSREGFVFSIELQVQIHVPDTKAPKVISMVGTMLNLVNEVLQSAVGNHFRNTLQDQPAVTFIETRMQVQVSALEHVTEYLQLYEVETKGVYIQNVVFPPELVKVLTEREIANQEKATYEEMQRAQTSRIEMEKAKGTADMQGQLASAQVNVEIEQNRANARTAEAQGEASYVELTGKAEATRVEAIGLANATATEALGVARAAGFEAQKEALGETATALVAVANAVSEGHITVVPEVLVTGGGGSFEGLAATLMRTFGNGNGKGSGNGKGLAPPQPEATVDAPAPGEAISDVDMEADAITNSEPIPPAAP